VGDTSTFPAEGIRHLVIEGMARDATLEGNPGADTIEASYPAAGRGAGPIFDVEGETARLSGVTPIRVVVPAGATITVKSAGGDLRVQHLEGDVNLESVRGSLRLSELSGVIRVAQVDSDVRAQGVADLRLMGNCDGDLRFDDGEHLAAESVAGDVRIHNLEDARLGRLRGDLWVEKVRGALQVIRAEGDVRLTEIAGPVTVRALAGDLRASALTGGLSAPQVTGDAVLQGPYGSVGPYLLSAEGDIVLHLPADADARVSIKAGGRIRSDAPLTPATDGSAAFSATLGRGAAQIGLAAGGDLRIVQGGGGRRGRGRSKDSADLGDLGERIRQQVSASLAAAGINTAGEVGLGGSGRPRPPREPKPPRPPSGEGSRSASDVGEELAAVLKMVEEGKITPEQADSLLKALGV
jgi:hypothetical protein